MTINPPLMATHYYGNTYICRTNKNCYALDCNGDIDRQIKFNDKYISLDAYEDDVYGWHPSCASDYWGYY